jgi:hypothetical protein
MPRPRLSRLIRAAGLACLLAGSSMAAWAAPQAGRQAKAPPQRGEQRSSEQARSPAPAHDRRDGQRALAEAVRRAERATRGQVLSAERVQYDGRDLNRVKLVDDRGRVRVYWDDPADGGARGRGDGGGERRGNPRTRDDDDRSD